MILQQICTKVNIFFAISATKRKKALLFARLFV